MSENLNDNNYKQALDDIQSIKTTIANNTVFSSLSGLGFLIAGIIATIGFAVILPFLETLHEENALLPRLHNFSSTYFSIVYVVALFTLSIISIFGFSFFRSKKIGKKFLDSSSAKLLINFVVPFTIGSLIILKLMIFGSKLSFINVLSLWNILASVSLFVYGISLFSARNNMPKIFTVLAWTEIIIGSITLFLPTWLTWKFWIFGFGIMHIIVGICLIIVNRTKSKEQ